MEVSILPLVLPAVLPADGLLSILRPFHPAAWSLTSHGPAPIGRPVGPGCRPDIARDRGRSFPPRRAIHPHFGPRQPGLYRLSQDHFLPPGPAQGDRTGGRDGGARDRLREP